MSQDNLSSWVHDNIEVTKTSRRAERKLKSGKLDVLIEITPKDQTNGTWKKWCHPEELFEVQPTDGEIK